MLARSQATWLAIVACTGGLIWCGMVLAQERERPPAPPGAEARVAAGAAADGKVEALARGPLHEAFAAQTTLEPVVGEVVRKQPPEAIEEVPPQFRPAGDDVVWIPGYWAWDPAAADFLWVSGCYRNAPPGMRWVPGYWNRAEGGSQWTSGFWIRGDAGEVAYYAPPPDSLERGPSSPAPGDDYFWVSGSWEPHQARYRWRPGYWAVYHPQYVWVSSYYIPTPAGYVFVPGFWDYPLLTRGMVFAPIRVRGGAALRYTPHVAINLSNLQLHLFSRTGARSYLFGNYYDDQFVRAGIHPWFVASTGVSLPDPLFGYYRWRFSRDGSDYEKVLTAWHQKFAADPAARPAATVQEQAKVKEGGSANRAGPAVLAESVEKLAAAAPTEFVKVSAKEEAALAAEVKDQRVLAKQRVATEEAAGPVKVQGKAAADQEAKLPVKPLNVPKVNVPEIKDLPADPSKVERDAGGAIDNATPRDRTRRRDVIPETPDAPRDAPKPKEVVPNKPKEVVPKKGKASAVPKAETPRVPQGESKPKVEIPAVPDIKPPGNVPVPRLPL